MERKQDGFVPLGDVNAGVELPDGRVLTPAVTCRLSSDKSLLENSAS